MAAANDRRFERFEKAPSPEALRKLNAIADGCEEFDKEIQKLKAYAPYSIFICSDDLPVAIHVLGVKKGTED